MAVSFHSGETLAEKISPFDTFIRIIDGEAAVLIDGDEHRLSIDNTIIIPAHTRNGIEAKVRFKMISNILGAGTRGL